MENIKDLSRFDGVIISRNFPAFKRAVAAGLDIVLNYPSMRYTTIKNGCVMVVELAKGERQYHGEWCYHMTDSLKQQLNEVARVIDDPANELAIKELARLCGISTTYFCQNISRKVTDGVVTSGMPLSRALYASGISNKKEYLDERPFNELLRKPKIEIGRYYDNRDKSTFDFINVDIVICLAYSEAKSWAQIHRKELVQYAIDAVKDNDRFKKFNVPINFLKIDTIVIQHDCILHFTFSLKGDENS